jgi:hypothetical protein
MGEQVAFNKDFHCNVVLHINESGEYYPVTQCLDKYILIKGQYLPIGNTLQYPKRWGRKKGALHLLDFRIADKLKVLEDAQRELDMLTACRDKVLGWDDK